MTYRSISTEASLISYTAFLSTNTLYFQKFVDIDLKCWQTNCVFCIKTHFIRAWKWVYKSQPLWVKGQTRRSKFSLRGFNVIKDKNIHTEDEQRSFSSPVIGRGTQARGEALNE